MTEQLTRVVVENAPLLRALQAGGAASPAALAEIAGILPNHIHRKLDALEGEGWIVRAPDAPKHEAVLTEASERALSAISVYDGAPIQLAGGESLIPFDRIDAWAGNPRTHFDPRDTEEMAVSIADKGVLQAIRVRPKAPIPGQDGNRFEVVIGERRRRGSALAVSRGLVDPGFLMPCVVGNYTDEEAEEIAGIENVQREDMHWMDLARYFRRLMDERRKSGPELERLFGRRYSARKIQDYAKIARELAPEAQAKAYLPEKIGDGDDAKPNPDCLTYTRARDQVGDKKERPALDLTPKPACVLMEVIARGLAQAAGQDRDGQYPVMPTLGSVVTTRFAKPFAGGPLATLSNDRKLIAFGFEGREIVATTRIGEDVHRWLTQLAFDSDPHGALWRVRAAVVGDMETHRLEREGLCVTEELNFPKPAEPAQAPEPEEDDGLDPDAIADMIRDGRDPESEDDDQDIPPFLRRLAGGGEAAQPAGPTPQRMVEAPPTDAAAVSPAPVAPAPAAAPPPLPAMLEIIVVELAHKMGAGAIKSPAGGLGAPVMADYYKDARISQLVQGWKLLAIHPAGEKTLAVQTEAARAWLTENYGLELADGRVTLGDAVLQQAQMTLLGAKPSPGPYSTPWLNPPAKAETPEAAELETPDPLTPSQRRVLREIAARSLHRHRLLDGWVTAHAAATEDPDFQALYDLELIMRKQVGEAEIEVALTLRGRDHLKARGQAPQDGLSRNSCATHWLRETLPVAPAIAAAETEDEFDRIGRLAGEVRALNSLASAARQAAELLTKLKSRTKAPKAEEIDPMVRLLETALEACAQLLPKDEG